MLRPLDPESFADDPAVRGTVARLRVSVVAVVVATIALVAVGVAAARMAFLDGLRQGQVLGPAARDTIATPSPLVLALVVGGCTLIGVILYLVVRAPYERAREQSVELARAGQQIADSTLETFAALNAAVEAKDRYTAGHGLRVTLVSMLIAQELGLSQRELDVLRLAATFHDIGKIAVPDVVLQKPGRLSDGEFEAMKVHPVEGARICSKLQALRPAVPLVRSHHERMDGRGYPDGLSGEAIPIGARIIAVADTWDAITSDRPYRAGQPAFVALEEVRRCAGAQFDARVVTAFIEVLAKDPWMFGLTPEDVSDSGRPLPAPTPVSRGVDADGDGLADTRRRGSAADPGVPVGDVDWSQGFDEEDLRAA